MKAGTGQTYAQVEQGLPAEVRDLDEPGKKSICVAPRCQGNSCGSQAELNARSAGNTTSGSTPVQRKLQ